MTPPWTLKGALPALARLLAAGVVAVVLAVPILRWYGGFVTGATSAECPPAVDRVNAACARLEKGDVGVRCSSDRPTPEWPACLHRDQIELSWDASSDSGLPSRASAWGAVTESKDTPDGGAWQCSNGQITLSLWPSMILPGEEGRAAIAFRKACARFVDMPQR